MINPKDIVKGPYTKAPSMGDKVANFLLKQAIANAVGMSATFLAKRATWLTGPGLLFKISSTGGCENGRCSDMRYPDQPPSPNIPFPDFNSPNLVDPKIQKKFCEQNPSAPNCKPEPDSCP